LEGVIGNLVAAVDEEGNRLSDEQIKDNLLLVLLAGHDTSSTTLTHVMTQLQQHPEAMEKLREEQRTLIEKYGSDFKAAVLSKMSYADAVIRWVSLGT
jgi:cytochrome P450